MPQGEGTLSVWFLLQVVVNLVIGLGVVVLWVKSQRPAKEDPRLSKGLQLLQSKIAVFEDLSDRTDVQVRQLMALIDQKSREIQQKIQDAEKQIQLISHSMSKSMEVAKIFQDKIPHQEIIERQDTLKYMAAARLAHEGKSAEEIANKMNITVGEAEMIVNLNRDKLMVSNDQLPLWASVPDQDLSEAFAPTPVRHASLEKLGEQFRQAVQQMAPTPPAVPIVKPVAAEKTPTASVRPVKFPKINIAQNLG